MDEDKIESRFNQLEKRVSDGFLHMENLIETLATLCAHQFESIDERFSKIDDRFDKIDKRVTAVDERLESIEDKIEAFSHRMDNEVEARHQLAERFSKIEDHL
jgi:DNA anti-recombination protein RmuC